MPDVDHSPTPASPHQPAAAAAPPRDHEVVLEHALAIGGIGRWHVDLARTQAALRVV